MIRFLLSCTAFASLAGCLSWLPGGQTGGSANAGANLAGPPAAVGQYHFGWKLSGNRAVAPLQVFDDGHRTWLQFPPGQPAPAIFARLPEGDQLLTPVTGQGGLLMLDGVWPQLTMRGGTLQSVALRLPADASPLTPSVAPSVAPTAAPPATFPTTSPATFPVTSPVVAAPGAILLPAASAATPAPSAHAPFQISPADGTLRAALSRWASTAGWTFSFEHWAVEVDIPVVAAATFALPFEQAVQELVASTELSDQPLRPCFYTNQVLRIVPHTQPCDRSAASRG